MHMMYDSQLNKNILILHILIKIISEISMNNIRFNTLFFYIKI